MKFHIEYKDQEGLDQIIHLCSKNSCEALNESQQIARHLYENKILKWSLVVDRDDIIYE
jgi:hypothetical protein